MWQFFKKRKAEKRMMSGPDLLDLIAGNKAYHGGKLAGMQMGPDTEMLLRYALAAKLDRRPHDLPNFNGGSYEGIRIEVVETLPPGQLVLYDKNKIPLSVYN